MSAYTHMIINVQFPCCSSGENLNAVHPAGPGVSTTPKLQPDYWYFGAKDEVKGKENSG